MNGLFSALPKVVAKLWMFDSGIYMDQIDTWTEEISIHLQSARLEEIHSSPYESVQCIYVLLHCMTSTSGSS